MLKKILIVAFAFVFGLGDIEAWAVAPISTQAPGAVGYYMQPTIAGDKLVFVCEDDLWSVSANGGVASRLTAGRGACSSPKLSPDGQQIAFVGREDGDEEVYVMPCAGGAAKRLTFLGGHRCFVSGWSPDSTKILFSSDAGTNFSGLMQPFSISPEGGEAVALHYGPVQTMAINASGAKLIGRNSFDPATWKRYRGGQAGELWIDEAGLGDFQPLIKLPGKMENGRRIEVIGVPT